MPKYKLMYFNSRGRAETSRMLFALAGQEFEDYRFKDGEWPGELKGNADLFPLGQAPVLIIDGKAMPHSKAMHRHLAREFGLYGANNEEARLIDVVSETCEDIISKIIPIHYEKDEAKKKELLENFKTSSKTFLSYLCKFVENEKFFVGSKESLADVVVHTTMDYVNGLYGEECVAENWPGLARFYKNIKEHSALSEYIKNRPETLADVIVFWMLDFMFPLITSTAAEYPALDRFHKGIRDNSKLTDYIKNRPETPN